MVLDGLAPIEKYDPDWYIDLDEKLQRQSVVMVRTGNESALSEPISLQSLREQVLPLARPDIDSHDRTDAVRVTLATAVRFVTDLQRREEAAIPESAPIPAVERSLYPHRCSDEIDPAKLPNVTE